MLQHHLRPVSSSCVLSVAVACLWATTVGVEAAAAAAPDAKRIEEIAAMLPKSPQGVGPTIARREQWQEAAAHPQFKSVVASARKLVATPAPELTDELYLDFSRTGNRDRAQKVIRERNGRLPDFVLAECIENQGKFLPAIEAAIRMTCAEKAWTLPAHDRSLNNFSGKQLDIDLLVANTAWNLATADYWLGEKLSPEVRKLLRAELKRRVFDPFEGYVREGKPRMSWPTTTNNWNAVCLAGVTGAALAVLESPQQRAFYAAAAERYIDNFLAGFTPDGYCSEGVGYWNYGFGHFALLAETLRQATGGRIDLLQRPKVREIALFGRHLEILPGVYPAFADCHVGAQPDPVLTANVFRRLDLALWPEEQSHLELGVGPGKQLFVIGVYGFAKPVATRVAKASGSAEMRDYFPEAGILICRPRKDSPVAFGAAFKGGHNAEHHNHNDVGSFVIAVGKGTPLLDPGSEVYTARTFSGKRYDSKVLNSFGHPVPRIAGQLQREGRTSAAKVLKTEFTDRADMYVLDIKSPYPVKSLKKLERTFVFSREGNGSVRVIDEVEFDSPQTFETALITFSKWQSAGASRLTIGSGAEAVTVEIDTGGEAFDVKAEEIKEDLPGKRVPIRLGIAIKEAVAKARVQLTIAPAGKVEARAAREPVLPFATRNSATFAERKATEPVESPCAVEVAAAGPEKEEQETDPLVLKKLERFQDWKFGLFMHWGIYSQWGCIESWPLVEVDKWARPDDLRAWTQRNKDFPRFLRDYQALNTTFHPKKFDPQRWADAAKAAGMKYMVFTTKHHDGFCMFGTRQTDYRTTHRSCPFSADPRADVVKAVFDTFRKEGFGIGAYYSKSDWHHPGYWSPEWPHADRNVNYDTAKYPERWATFVKFTHNIVEELISGYGPVDILWLDGGQVRPPKQDIDMPGLAAMARRHQPGLIVVDRTVGGRYENYRTPEQEVPAKALPYVWETCMTMGDQWSYKPNDKYKSTRKLIHLLVDIVAKGGNFLLNIGPDADGQFPPPALERLDEIGRWMKVNGDAIYGTRAVAPFKEGRVCLTKKGDKLYLICLAEEGEAVPPAEIKLACVKKLTAARMLGLTDAVQWTSGPDGTTFRLPAAARQSPPCQHAWTLEIITREN